MRTLWNIVSFMAVVNLLALAAFIAWLWHSDRLSADRIAQIRSMLSDTVSEQNQMEMSAASAAADEQRQQLEQQRQEAPPLPSAQQVAAANQHEERQRGTLDRLDDEKNLLLAQLDRIRNEYDASQLRFKQERDKWYASIESERQRKEDEQFQQALKVYEQIPARQARDMLLALVADGDQDQAVAYLDAMNSRTAAKIIREFKSQPQTQLAKDLLERLRTFGVIDAEPQDSSNEHSIASAGGSSGEPQR